MQGVDDRGKISLAIPGFEDQESSAPRRERSDRDDRRGSRGRRDDRRSDRDDRDYDDRPRRRRSDRDDRDYDRDDRRSDRRRSSRRETAIRVTQPTRTTTSTVPIAKSVPSVLAAASAATLILLRTDASKDPSQHS